MPQFATITLPVADTDLDNDMLFKPVRNQNGVAFFVDRTLNGVDFGNITPQVTISNSAPSKTSRLQKTRVKLVLPNPAKDSSGNTLNVKEFESVVDITFSTPDRSTQSHRRDLLNIAVALLKQTALMESLVVDGESVYA